MGVIEADVEMGSEGSIGRGGGRWRANLLASMRPLAKSALDAIGNTPLVKLSNVLPFLGIPNANLFAKLDNLNVGGSKKDRVAKQMVLDARENGQLNEGQAIIEVGRSSEDESRVIDQENDLLTSSPLTRAPPS